MQDFPFLQLLAFNLSNHLTSLRCESFKSPFLPFFSLSESEMVAPGAGKDYLWPAALSFPSTFFLLLLDLGRFLFFLSFAFFFSFSLQNITKSKFISHFSLLLSFCHLFDFYYFYFDYFFGLFYAPVSFRAFISSKVGKKTNRRESWNDLLAFASTTSWSGSNSFGTNWFMTRGALFHSIVAIISVFPLKTNFPLFRKNTFFPKISKNKKRLLSVSLPAFDYFSNVKHSEFFSRSKKYVFKAPTFQFDYFMVVLCFVSRKLHIIIARFFFLLSFFFDFIFVSHDSALRCVKIFFPLLTGLRRSRDRACVEWDGAIRCRTGEKWMAWESERNKQWTIVGKCEVERERRRLSQPTFWAKEKPKTNIFTGPRSP